MLRLGLRNSNDFSIFFQKLCYFPKFPLFGRCKLLSWKLHSIQTVIARLIKSANLVPIASGAPLNHAREISQARAFTSRRFRSREFAFRSLCSTVCDYRSANHRLPNNARSQSEFRPSGDEIGRWPFDEQGHIMMNSLARLRRLTCSSAWWNRWCLI